MGKFGDLAMVSEFFPVFMFQEAHPIPIRRPSLALATAALLEVTA